MEGRNFNVVGSRPDEGNQLYDLYIDAILFVEVFVEQKQM